jgi:hypothetical protein
LRVTEYTSLPADAVVHIGAAPWLHVPVRKLHDDDGYLSEGARRCGAAKLLPSPKLSGGSDPGHRGIVSDGASAAAA